MTVSVFSEGKGYGAEGKGYGADDDEKSGQPLRGGEAKPTAQPSITLREGQQKTTTGGVFFMTFAVS